MSVANKVRSFGKGLGRVCVTVCFGPTAKSLSSGAEVGTMVCVSQSDTPVPEPSTRWTEVAASCLLGSPLLTWSRHPYKPGQDRDDQDPCTQGDTEQEAVSTVWPHLPSTCLSSRDLGREGPGRKPALGWPHGSRSPRRLFSLSWEWGKRQRFRLRYHSLSKF